MLGVVFGEAASPQLVTQIEALFDLVQNPAEARADRAVRLLRSVRVFTTRCAALWQAQNEAKAELAEMAGRIS